MAVIISHIHLWFTHSFIFIIFIHSVHPYISFTLDKKATLFSVKEQMINVIVFADHTVPATRIPLCHCNRKAATDTTETDHCSRATRTLFTGTGRGWLRPTAVRLTPAPNKQQDTVWIEQLALWQYHHMIILFNPPPHTKIHSFYVHNVAGNKTQLPYSHWF